MVLFNNLDFIIIMYNTDDLFIQNITYLSRIILGIDNLKLVLSFLIYFQQLHKKFMSQTCNNLLIDLPYHILFFTKIFL